MTQVVCRRCAEIMEPEKVNRDGSGIQIFRCPECYNAVWIKKGVQPNCLECNLVSKSEYSEVWECPKCRKVIRVYEPPRPKPISSRESTTMAILRPDIIRHSELR